MYLPCSNRFKFQSKRKDNMIYITLNTSNSSQIFFDKEQENCKFHSTLYRFKRYKYGKVGYEHKKTNMLC